MNYLRPDVKRDSFTEEEEDLIFRLHKLLGNRFDLSSNPLIPSRDFALFLQLLVNEKLHHMLNTVELESGAYHYIFEYSGGH